MKRRDAYQFLLVAPIWIFLSVAAGMRWLGQDRDYVQYLDFYDSLSRDWPFDTSRFEPGFVGIAWVSKNFLGLNLGGFLTLLAAVALGIKIILFFRRPYPWALLAAYVPSLYLLHEMTQIRVALALAFVYSALEDLYSNRKGRSFGLMLMGVSMQTSVGLFLPLLLVSRSWIEKKNILSPVLIFLVIVPAVCMYFVLDYLETLNPLAGAYIAATNDPEVNLASLRNALLFSMLGISIFGFRKFAIDVKVQVIISAAGFVLFFSLIRVPTFAHRILELSMLSYFLWVTRIPRVYAIPATSALLAMCGYLGYRQMFIDPLFY